jgi:Chaperone of endosialidase
VTTGGGNIGVGYGAGNSVTNGTSNIEIGNSGTSADSDIIRIGTSGTQTATYIAGIAGAAVTGGSAVLVDPITGQLGILLSSERFKQDIHDMDAASDALMQLRPVTFRYKDPRTEAKGIQYGLIAEEVAAVYPQLVVHGRDGQVESVQYHQLPALLLNEMQKQHQTIQRLEQRIVELEALVGNKVQATRVSGN